MGQEIHSTNRLKVFKISWLLANAPPNALIFACTHSEPCILHQAASGTRTKANVTSSENHIPQPLWPPMNRSWDRPAYSQITLDIYSIVQR